MAGGLGGPWRNSANAPAGRFAEHAAPREQKSVFKRLSAVLRNKVGSGTSKTLVEGIRGQEPYCHDAFCHNGSEPPLRQAADLEPHYPQRGLANSASVPAFCGPHWDEARGYNHPARLDSPWSGRNASLPCGAVDSSPICDRWGCDRFEASTASFMSSHRGISSSSPSVVDRTPSCSSYRTPTPRDCASNYSTPRYSPAQHCFITADAGYGPQGASEAQAEVFMMYASPLDHAPIDVTAEVEVVNQAITESRARIQLNVGVATAGSLTKLLTLARSRKGLVLHLSAHAVQSGPGGIGLVLEDANGGSHVLWREDLEELLGMREQGLRNISLLFLSCCFSEQLAQVFVECGCRHVVAVRTRVHDAAARRFAQQFYLSLAISQSLMDAWEGARRALRIDPHKALAAQAEHFVLFGQHGADQATLSSLCGVEAQPALDAGFSIREFEAAELFLRSKLPQRAENFVGRSNTIYELMAAFSGPRGRRACAVHGPQGIGKSALGAEFGHFASTPGRSFSCATLIVRIETLDLDGIVASLEEQLGVLSEQLRVPIRTMSGVSRGSSMSRGSAGSSCSRSESLNSLDLHSEDPLSLLLPAQTRIRRAFQSLERARGRTARTLLIIDDQVGAIGSDDSEARRMLGDLLEHTSQLHVLMLSRDPVYKSLGTNKVYNLQLEGLNLRDASNLFLQRIHRPLEPRDFTPPFGSSHGGTGPGLPYLRDKEQVCGKLSSHRLMLRLAGHPGHIRAVSSRVTPNGLSLLSLAELPDLLDLAASPSSVEASRRGGEPAGFGEDV